MRYALLLLVAALSFCGTSDSYAACELHPGDEMWLVSTRCLPSCGYYNGSVAPNYTVHRYEERRWVRSSLEEYLATQSPETLTVCHMNGNRYEQSDAIERGWQTYHMVRQCETAWPRVRMVVWSWPSEQIHGPLKDLRTKAARTDVEAYYFGYFLAQHQRTSQLSLIGHSFGARVITGALHLAAGGRLRSGCLQNSPETLPAIRAVIMAAAMHSYWLAQGQYHGRALDAVQSMRILYNPQDRFLIRYALLVPGERPTALGVTGPTGYLGPNRQKIELFNVAPYVGTDHFQRIYYQKPMIRKLIRDHAMWHAAPLPAAEQQVRKDSRNQSL